MSTLVRVQSKGQVTIPTKLRSRAGISEGAVIEASLHQGRIVLTPRLTAVSPNLRKADTEYTASQRKAINARLDKSEDELRQGHSVGPFDTAAETIAHVRAQLKES